MYNNKPFKPSPDIWEMVEDIYKNHSTIGNEYGILTSEDARMLYEAMKKKEVLAGYTFPTKPCGKGNRWCIYVKDSNAPAGRRKIWAKSRPELEEKVYRHECGLNGSLRKTFKKVFELVQEEKTRYVKDPEKLLSVRNTIQRNKSEYTRFFSDTAIEQKYIDEITERDLDDICVMNLRRYDMRKKAFLSMRSIMKSIFDLAFYQRWIDDNPYLRVNFSRYKDMLEASVATEDRLHSGDDIDRMLEYIHQHQKAKPGYVASYALEFQIVTAMRRGEIPPLEWTDIYSEIDGGYILIAKEQIYVKGVKPERFCIVHHTKTYRDRKFPITADVDACLQKIRQLHELFYPDCSFLFPANTETGCITNNVVYQFYRRMCKKLDIPISRDIIKGTQSFRRNAITRVMNDSNGGAMMASKL